MRPRKIPLGNKNKIGETVTRLRKDRHMTLAQLMARMQTRGADIHYTSLSRLEGQIRTVSEKERSVLSEIFGVKL